MASKEAIVYLNDHWLTRSHIYHKMGIANVCAECAADAMESYAATRVAQALAEQRAEMLTRGKCTGCGEIVDVSETDWMASHARPEHDPRCDGSCSVGCPIPVQCGPVAISAQGNKEGE